MTTSMLDILRTQLSSGLVRRASTTCSRWAENYIHLGKPVPGPLRFTKHPWSKRWHDENGNWVGKKAAQMAMSQAAIDRTIFTIDVKRVDAMYILPKKNPDAADFSKSKFDPLVELSPHLQGLFQNVKNVGHKQAGNVNLFIRGSRSRSALKSISVGLRVYDEYDEMYMKNIALSEERSSGFEETDKQEIRLSTPTVPNFGISLLYQQSTQEHFFFRCPNCSQLTEFLPVESLVITADSVLDEHGLRKSYLKTACGHQVDHRDKPIFLAKGEWNSTANSDSYTSGFQINQLYSCVMEPWQIAKVALEAHDSPEKEQELFNSKYGMEHLVAGAKVDAEILRARFGNYKNGTRGASILRTMGIDVGKRLHYQISEWSLPQILGPDINTFAIKMVRRAGFCVDFSELDRLMREFQVMHTVIDANPETRKAQELCDRFPGQVSMCYFHRNAKNTKQFTQNGNVVSVGRTPWLDLSIGRFRAGTIIIPNDLDKEYGDHFNAIARISAKDADGNPIAKYVSTGPDHAVFANVYDEVALPLALARNNNSSVDIYL